VAVSLSVPGVQEWSYLRGGLSTIDRDFGVFNKIHHDIVPQIPHYHLEEATEARPYEVMGLCTRDGL